MKIALYGKTFNKEFLKYIQELITKLESLDIELSIYEPFYEFLKKKINFTSKFSVFNTHEEVRKNVDFFFSIGGDGTLLNTITLIRDSGIPVLGINTGRLGFLSSISKEKINSAIDNIINKRIFIEPRTLLRLETKENLFGDFNYALNELTIQKKDFSSMILIHAYINDEFLNSYWADGLIVATPTGATGYSLSCGGPIITPGSENFIITPIATHNLTVRPIVIPDNSVIRLKVEGRSRKFLVGLDSRSETINSSVELKIIKENFKVNFLRMEGENFFTTIRNKLLWGLDIRN